MPRPHAGWALAAALITAGCHTGSAPQPPAITGSTSSPVPSSASTGHGAYAHCLAEHGVAGPPGPAGPPAGVDPATWDSAREACAALAPGPAS